jgi:hypothetical protein
MEAMRVAHVRIITERHASHMVSACNERLRASAARVV